MKKEGTRTLRLQAENAAHEKAWKSAENHETLSPEEIKRTLHELRVHQIELEMQNEELRRAHEDLEKARARYLDLYNFAPLGYVTLNKKGIVLEANLTAATMLGIAQKKLIKEAITSYIFPEDQDIYYLHSKDLFKTASGYSDPVIQPQGCELRMLKHDGTAFWAHLESATGRNNDGVQICRIVISDISKRKQAEEEHEKIQTQLNQAQKMEAVGLLAGGVAHDYNNMLSVIIGYTELALPKVDVDLPLHQYLEEIHKAAMRSAAITRQLLTYARKQVISPVLLDLNQAVESMLKMLRRLIGENINLIWLPEEGQCQVKMDPIQIDQILANLCVNARDAIQDVGNITIATRRAYFSKSCQPDQIGLDEFIVGKYVLLTVSDNGCGMEKKVLNQIFEPFFTTKGIGQGTGLGLSMVDGIVKQNNGYINVTSEPDKGTTFTIYLPCYADQAIENTCKLSSAIVTGSEETILLVEDEPSLLMMGRMMLEKLGYRVLSALTPGEAIDLAKTHSSEIRILVTDIIMPEMNGKQLAQQIQTICPDIKILFMSGYAANVMADRGLLDKGVEFIQKPFSMKDLAVKIRETQKSA